MTTLESFDSRRHVLRLIATCFAVVAMCAAMPPTPAHAKLPTPAPQFADCLGWSGPGMCVWKAGFVSFELSKRVLHVGDTVTGSYTWGPLGYDTRSVTFTNSGAGLRLVGCTPLNGQLTAGKDAKGTRTCTWKAVTPTGSWQIGPQITLHGNAGAGSWPYQDFYIVLGKEMVITGRVVRENIDGTTKGARQGIPNVVVKVHGPQSRSVRTDSDGFYTAEVTKSGMYRVTPQMTTKLGGIRASKPASRRVAVSSTRAATADFEVEDNLTVTGTVDRPSVRADGRQALTLTLTATQYGEPEPNLVVAVMPNGDTVGANPNAMPVPARYCTDNRVAEGAWPTVQRGLVTFEQPLDVMTDAAGTATVRVQVGTVPGALRIKWWARRADRTLNYAHISNVSGEVSVTAEPTPPASGSFFRALGTARVSGAPMLPSDAWGLMQVLRTDERYALGASYTFVNPYPGNRGAILVSPQTSVPTIGLEREITPGPGSFILEPGLLSLPVRTLYGSFDGAIAAGAVDESLPVDRFMAGLGASGWDGWSASQGAKLYAADSNHWVGAGYPYDAVTGGC